MASTHEISSKTLTISDIVSIVNHKTQLRLSEDAKARIIKCRTYLDQKIQQSDEPIYGINTGFGSLYSQNIAKEELSSLQYNLVKSHACGTGAEVPKEIVQLMLLLKIQSLSYGHSGIQLVTIERLIEFYNNEIYPVIYEMGSLGASGDLAPLAHLSLPLIGLGVVDHQGERISGQELNQRMNWEAIPLMSKEGLALLNGTQLMSAYGVWALIQSERMLTLANTIGALSLDTFDGRIEAFSPLVHQIRTQAGQISVAQKIRELLANSELITQPKKHVQDPYSFRCIPQVHGATSDAIDYIRSVFLKEINGVTDNPNIFPDEDQIISGGNFHGQPLAITMDFLCIAMAELGSISERRTYQLISGSRGLPNYLVANPGLNSGLMIPQYTAASLVSQNKQLCSPASIDSIVSSNGQEDHVSMGANAATKSYKLINNLYSILAIEMITASQALEFRRPLKTSPVLEEVVNNFRKEVSFIENDRLLHDDMIAAEQFLKAYAV